MAADLIVPTSSPKSIPLGYKLMDPGPGQYYAPIVYVEGGGGGGGGVEPTTDPLIVYGTDAAGDPALYGVNEDSSLGTVPLRHSDSGALRAATPLSSDPDASGNDLVNRDYLEAHAMVASENPLIVYGTDEAGAQVEHILDIDGAPSSVAFRTEFGTLRAATMVADGGDPDASPLDLVNRDALTAFRDTNLVQKTLNAFAIYGTDGDGLQKEYTASDYSDFAGGSLMLRTVDGYAQAATMIIDGDDPAASLYDLVNRDALQIAMTPKTFYNVCSDDAVPLLLGNTVTFRAPFGMNPADLRASLTTEQTSGADIEIDITIDGVSLLVSPLTIISGERTSGASPVQYDLVPGMNIGDDAEIKIVVTQIGDGTAVGLKVWIIGH